MLNLGICRTCPRCEAFRPAMLDEAGNKVRKSFVECGLADDETMLGWGSEVPEGCPYVLEHKLSEEAVSGLEDDDDA